MAGDITDMRDYDPRLKPRTAARGNVQSTRIGSSERLLFRCGRRTFFLRPSQLLWIQGEGNYSRVHSTVATFLVRELIGSLDERLQPLGFRRVHRSILVNVEQIVELRRAGRYKQLIILADGTQLPVAADYWRDLDQLVQTEADGGE